MHLVGIWVVFNSYSCECSRHEAVGSLFGLEVRRRFVLVLEWARPSEIPVGSHQTWHVVLLRMVVNEERTLGFSKFLSHSAMCCYVYYFCGNPIFDREQFDVRPEAQAYSLLVRIHPCLPCMSLTVIHQNRSLAESTERFAQLRAARRVHAMRELLVGIVNPVPSSDSPVG